MKRVAGKSQRMSTLSIGCLLGIGLLAVWVTPRASVGSVEPTDGMWGGPCLPVTWPWVPSLPTEIGPNLHPFRPDNGTIPNGDYEMCSGGIAVFTGQAAAQAHTPVGAVQPTLVTESGGAAGAPSGGCSSGAGGPLTPSSSLVARTASPATGYGVQATVSLHGKGAGPVDLASGDVHEAITDLTLPTTAGVAWRHHRTYSALANDPNNEEGPNWRSQYWAVVVPDDSQAPYATDVTVTLDYYTVLEFDWNGSTWDPPNHTRYALSYDDTNHEYVLTTPAYYKLKFHDFTVDDGYGRLKAIEDNYGRGLTFSYAEDTVQLEEVEDADGHTAVYSYLTSGTNSGKLNYIQLYKSTTTDNANLIGRIDFTYYDDTTHDYGGTDGDLLLVTVKQWATDDAAGTLSIEKSTHYRYHTSLAVDHKLKMIVRPENVQRIMEYIESQDVADVLDEEDTTVDDYAAIQYTYDAEDGYRVDDTTELGNNCPGCGGAATGMTLYTWTMPDPAPTTYNGCNMHALAELPSGDHIYVDTNKAGDLLTWVFDDGSNYWRYHIDYGEEGVNPYGDEGRMTYAYGPETVTNYNASTYAVTTYAAGGPVYKYTYADCCDKLGMLEKIEVQAGGSTIALQHYFFFTDDDAILLSYRGPSSTSTSDENTGYAYTFWDDDNRKLKTITTSLPKITTGHNGPNARPEIKVYYDASGRLRWTKDAEGSINYYGYDDGDGASGDKTGMRDLVVIDVDTDANDLPSSVDDDWTGDVPTGFTSSSGLNLESVRTYDPLGRRRKATAPDDTVTYYTYADSVTQVLPGWDNTNYKTYFPTQVIVTDKQGRVEQLKTVETDTVLSQEGGVPDGDDTFTNDQLASLTVFAYNTAGQRTSKEVYHNIPNTGEGDAFDDYYQTDYQYDDDGRLEYTVQQVAPTPPQESYPIEQVTQYVYDGIGRVIEIKLGVSDEDHDIDSDPGTWGFPKTVEKRYFDDPDDPISGGNRDSDPEQGVGAGLLSWVERYYGDSSAIAVRYGYDSRHRRTLILPPTGPYTLVKYDYQSRPTAVGTYKALTNLTVSADPTTVDYANRLSLSTTDYDYGGHVYQSTVYADPADDGPGDTLITENFYDRDGKLVASDPPDGGISFTKYDGAGRVTESFVGTQFDAAKYASGVFDYPDDDEGVVEHTAYTFDSSNKTWLKQITHKEVNHEDDDGIDLDGYTDSVTTYTVFWHDAAGRTTHTGYYGTNDGNGWKSSSNPVSPPPTAPSSGTSVLVTQYEFDEAGRVKEVTDPASKETRTTYDDLGRTIEVLQDAGGSDKLAIEYQYNGLSEVVKYIADPNDDNEFADGAWTMDTEQTSDVDQVTEYVYGDDISAALVAEIRYPTTDGVAGSGSTDKIVHEYHYDGTLDTITDQNGTVHTYAYDTSRRLVADKITNVGSDVDDTVLARTWTYTDAGRVEYVTGHDDATPDTSGWNDAVRQIRYHYNDFGAITKVEFDPDSEIGDDDPIAVRDVEYGFDTDFTQTDIEMHYRAGYVVYPSGRKIWYGYDHETDGWIQDEINDAFSRVGQIAEDDDSSMGDILVEYTYNGLGRLVQRVSDDKGGWNGNDTQWTLYATEGQYRMDRFGRIEDLRVQNFADGTVDLMQRKYSHDLASNRTKIEDPFWKLASGKYEYDGRHRLTDEKRGWLDSSGDPQRSDLTREFDLTEVGAPDFDRINNFEDANAKTITYLTNATNEITEIDVPHEAGPDLAVNEPFTSFDTNMWDTLAQSFTIDTGKLKAEAIGYPFNSAAVEFDARVADAAFQVKISIPTDDAPTRAGIMFALDDSSDGYAVTINPDTDRIDLYEVTGGTTLGLNPGFVSHTMNFGTEYTLTVVKRQARLEAWVNNGSTYSSTLVFNNSSINEFSSFGLITTVEDTTFDDFKAWSGFPREQAGRRWRSSAKTSLDTDNDELTVEGKDHGGEVVFTGHYDTNYIAQVDINLNSGRDASLYVRYLDPDNWYRVRIDDQETVRMEKMQHGRLYVLDSDSYTEDDWVTVKIKCNNLYIDGYVDGVNVDEGGDLILIKAGAVAVSGWNAKFRNLKFGYDNNADDDIDDAGDDVVFNDGFDGTSISPTYDPNGNLTKDADYAYTYDAWDNLVKIWGQNDSGIVVAEYTYYANDLRASKEVDNRGDLDETLYFFYDGAEVIEERDGSDNFYQHYVWGPNHIDELAMIMGLNGTYFAYQDANWNVIGLTTPGGDLAEEYNYTPYGRQLAWRHTGHADGDADSDLDSADITAYSAAVWTVKGEDEDYDRDFDADYDGDVDAFDMTAFGMAYCAAGDSVVVCNRAWSANQNPYGFTCRRLDTESLLMYYRFRTYNPTLKCFMQRDPLGYIDGSNLYQYVRGNPSALVDPTGRKCGSGWTDAIVPDKPLWWIDFTSACVTHDKCYGSLGIPKAQCDENFYLDMLALCAARYGPTGFGGRWCAQLARIYYEAVRDHGQSAYDGAQREAKRIRDSWYRQWSPPDSIDWGKVLNDMYYFCR